MEKLNLLLLEDATMDIYLVKKVLERSGMIFDMVVASDEPEFRAALDQGTYDAILADHSLPQFTSMDALQILRARGIDVPFIMVTGTVSEEFSVIAMKEGASDYILKDRLQRLPNAVASAIEKYKIDKERRNVIDEIIAKEALMKEAERMSHFGSWKADLVAQQSFWSDEKFRILGYEPGEITPSFDKFMARIHPDDLSRVQRLHEEAFENGDRLEYECRIHCKDGKLKFIHSELVLNRDACNKVRSINGFVGDITASKVAELKTIESEKKYRNLFEHNPMPISVLSADTLHFLDINTTAIRHYGYSREEFLGMTAFDISPAEERRRLFESLRSNDPGFNNMGVWQHLKKDGSIIHVEINVGEFFFEGKKAFMVLANDVTEKIKVERNLRQSESQLVASQRIAHIGSWEMTLNQDQITNSTHTWSDETYRIFGLHPNEVAPDSDLFNSMVHAEDRERIWAAVQESIDNKREYRLEHKIVCKDGTERHVQERGEIICDEVTGKPVKIAGTIQDITERVQAEELLHQSEANLRTIFDNADTGYALINPSLVLVSFNHPAAQFVAQQLHKTAKEGTNAVAYFSEEKQVGIRTSLLNALKGITTTYEINYPQPEGQDKWYQATYHPVWNKEQKILGVIMAIMNITERKISELQEKKITADILQRNKDLEQFTYIISHNLRAPVANIIGVSNLLAEQALDEDEKKQFIEALSVSAKKLDDVIIDLNEILQVKNKINEIKEQITFSGILNDIKHSINYVIEKEVVEISSDFSGIDELSTFKSYIYSIFHNLISNSIKYRRPDVVPVINISSQKADGKIVLVFSDNGLGIDLQKKGDQVFGLYKRFHPQYAEGKGVGLFMVKTQVETLGGRISVASEVNKGTRFTIELELPDNYNS